MNPATGAHPVHQPFDRAAFDRGLGFLSQACAKAAGMSSSLAVLHVVTCAWAMAHENLIITGSAGSGKTTVASTLAELARRQGHKIVHAPGLDRARGWSTPPEVVILDDWSGSLTALRDLLGHRCGRTTVVAFEASVDPDISSA